MKQLLSCLVLVTLALLLPASNLRTAQAGATALDSVTVFGLKHNGVGGVTLDTTTGVDGRRRLTACCLGSSGQDGVDIDLRMSKGWDGYFEPLDIPDAGQLEVGFSGGSGGLPPTVSCGQRLTGVGSGHTQLEAGFTGVTSVTLDAYLGDSLVYHETGHTGGPKGATIESNDRFPWLLICVIILAVSDLHNETGELEWDLETTFGSNDIQIAGGPIVHCDRIVIIPENPTVHFDDLQKVELRGKSIPACTILRERVRMFGLPHEALGNAVFDADATARRLPVNNLGSSGQDGVAIDLGKAGRWDAVWDSLDPGGVLPESASVASTAIGQVDGMPDQPIATTMVRKIGSLYELSADFSPIGATSLKVKVYNNGTLVDSVTGITATQFGTSNGCVDDDHWGVPTEFPHFGGTLTFRDPRQFAIGGLKGTTVVVGDELRMIPENPTATVESLSRIEVKAAKISEITLTDESMTVVYVCGDADGNGFPNISDAVFLIAYIFGSGPAPNPLVAGDVDCNGLVNISDVVFLVNYIFGGGPAPCAACL